MKLIDKRQEPHEWTEYRQTPGVVYESKIYLRKALYVEQGGICAYCMQRLDNELQESIVTTNRIEHIKCRERNANLQLDYQNMVICCKGKLKENINGPDFISCDLMKGNEDIHFSPFDPNFISSLSYNRRDGKILSSRADFQKDINDVLNLNNGLLKRNRASTFKGIRNILGNNSWKSSQINKMIEHWNARDKDGLYKPFCGMVVWYLEEKLSCY